MCVKSVLFRSHLFLPTTYVCVFDFVNRMPPVDYVAKVRLIEEELNKYMRTKNMTVEGNNNPNNTQYTVSVFSNDAVTSKRPVFTVILRNAQSRQGYANGDAVKGLYDGNAQASEAVYFSVDFENTDALKKLVGYMYSKSDCSLIEKSPYMQGYRKGREDEAGKQGQSTTPPQAAMTSRISSLESEVDSLTQRVAALTSENNELITWGKSIRTITAPRATPKCLLPVHH